MSGNEFHGKNPESQDEDYEKTVLNFLNKEIDHSKPGDGSEYQSKELDSIVSDLLKQVINESDLQQKNPQFCPEDPLSEFPDLPKNSISEKERPLPELTLKASQDVELQESASKAQAALFAPSISSLVKSRFSFKALALACVLAVIGSMVYFYMSRKSGLPKEASVPATEPASVVAQSAKAALPPTKMVGNREVQPSSTPVLPAEKPSAAKTVFKETAAATVVNGNVGSNPPKREAPAPINAPAAPIAAAPAPIAPVSSTTIVIEGRENSSAPSIIERSPVQPQTALLAPMKDTPELELAPISNGSTPKNLIPAEPISRAKAVYPAIALRTRASGTVVVEVYIDNAGKVVKALPVSGPAIFHDEAVKAVMKWRYRPASINGVDVASKNKAEIIFNLK